MSYYTYSYLSLSLSHSLPSSPLLSPSKSFYIKPDHPLKLNYISTTRLGLTALISEAEVSIVARRLSPILTDTICAPGATPLSSGRSGKFAAAIDAT